MHYLAVILLLFWTQLLCCQNTILGITAHYNYQIPMVDFAKKYSNNSNVGLNFNIKNSHNITIGISGDFIFGSTYKNTEPLGSYVMSNGYVLGKDGGIQTPSFEGRGGSFYGEIGKIIPSGKRNKNSGWHGIVGLGYFFHKAYLTADDLRLPQFNDVYKQGYDHAEAGWSIHQYLGYTFYGKDKLINFSIGLQGLLAFTKSQRNWDFSTNKYIGDEKYTNFLIGPKFSFTIPIYKNSKKELHDQFYYN